MRAVLLSCLVAVASTALVGACDRLQNTGRGQARAAVTGLLIDPSSAQIEFTHETPNAVCGMVNAKNRMGGYTGRQLYIFNKTTGQVELYGGPPAMSDVRSIALTQTSDPAWDQQLNKIRGECQFPAKWQSSCAETLPATADSTEICTTLAHGLQFADLMRRFE